MESEELREALFELDRTREREHRLRIESEGLLKGLDIITQSTSTSEAFVRLLEVIQDLIQCDNAFVLLENEPGKLEVVAATNSSYQGTQWQPKTVFERVLAGRPTILFNIDSIEEWQQQSSLLTAKVCSALHAPLAAPNKRAIIVCTSSQAAHFTKVDIKLLQRLSPLASQALKNSQTNGHLRSAIASAKSYAVKAEAASKSKSEFLANMSHEIRTPLNGIIGNIELAEEENVHPEIAGYLTAAQLSAVHLIDVVNDILDFSKVESGQLTLESVDFTLQHSLITVVESQRCQATEKGLKLDLRIEPEVLSVFCGDPVRLRQVLINLIGNAIKFTSEGSVVLKCESIARTDEFQELLLTVSDTGIGISDEQVSHIFSRFEQADGSVTRKYGGTGLGLSISKSLIELMKGEIWVESEQGVGSRFFVRVRLAVGQSGLLNSTSTTTDVVTRENNEKNYSDVSLRIMLAEDNPVNQRLASRMLEKLGHDVQLASDGLQALDFLRAQDFDLILMDIQMPNMDGLSATKEIRSWKNRKSQIPIIALTAHAMASDREKCLQVGMDDYLTKPLSKKVLEQTLKTWQAKIELCHDGFGKS